MSTRYSLAPKSEKVIQQLLAELPVFDKPSEIIDFAILGLYSQFKKGEINISFNVGINDPTHPFYSKTTPEEEKALLAVKKEKKPAFKGSATKAIEWLNS
jgi:hypothetical protein